ncbi:MAG: DNA-processing protein DprA [Flavobacteriales bacterium TMED191]|nr:MAG: DNA-processing protein DprA [Flavobacteriales bacterium TMED191]
MNIKKAANILTALSIKGNGPSKVKKLICQSRFENLDDLFDISSQNNKDILSETEWQVLREQIMGKLEWSLEIGIQVIPFSSSKYPFYLKQLKDFPLVLFVKGNIESINKNDSIAIVGTRNPTEYTINHGSIICDLISSNVESVISGLAIGCDTIAHKSALKKEVPTVAVLPNGLDSIYPNENYHLAQKIIEQGGALVSEYLVGVKPTRYQFVARDRIQAGLSKMGFLLESSITGGSMHCINKLKKLNRTIGCLKPSEELKENISWSGNKSLYQEKNFFDITPTSNLKNISLKVKSLLNQNKETEFNQKTIFD